MGHRSLRGQTSVKQVKQVAQHVGFFQPVAVIKKAAVKTLVA